MGAHPEEMQARGECDTVEWSTDIDREFGGPGTFWLLEGLMIGIHSG